MTDIENPYIDSQIVNIRPGKGARSHILYGELNSKTGELFIGVRVVYIVEEFQIRTVGSPSFKRKNENLTPWSKNYRLQIG